MEVTPKTGLHVLCGQKAHMNFSDKFGEIRAKILRTPKNLPDPTPMFGTVCRNAEAPRKFVQSTRDGLKAPRLQSYCLQIDEIDEVLRMHKKSILANNMLLRQRLPQSNPRYRSAKAKRTRNGRNAPVIEQGYISSELTEIENQRCAAIKKTQRYVLAIDQVINAMLRKYEKDLYLVDKLTDILHQIMRSCPWFGPSGRHNVTKCLLLKNRRC